MLKPYFQIIGGCLIWATYGLFVKKLEYPPEVVVFFRFLFGAVFLVFFSFLTGRSARLRPPANTGGLIMAGLFSGSSWLMYTYSIEYTSVSNSLILTYTAPCFVVFLAPLILKERVEIKTLGALASAFTGVALILGYGRPGTEGYSFLGNMLGLSSGLFYALSILSMKRLPTELLGIVSNFYICLTIAMVSFPLAVTRAPSFTLNGIILLISLGIVVQGVGSTLYMTGLSRTKAQQASVLSYSEVLFTMLFAVWFLNERLTAAFLAGVVLVIAGGLLVVISPVKKEKPQKGSKKFSA